MLLRLNPPGPFLARVGFALGMLIATRMTAAEPPPALFAVAPTRVGYLCLLTGRPAPERPERWADATIEAIIAHVDGAEPLSAGELQEAQTRLDAVMKGFGVPLTPADFATLAKARRTVT